MNRTHGLGLLVEDGLGLTTITALLPVVTTLTLGSERVLALLVLGNLVGGVLPAGLALAVGAASPGVSYGRGEVGGWIGVGIGLGAGE